MLSTNNSMLRIGVIAKVKELPKVCSSISGMNEIHCDDDAENARDKFKIFKSD